MLPPWSDWRRQGREGDRPTANDTLTGSALDSLIGATDVAHLFQVVAPGRLVGTDTVQGGAGVDTLGPGAGGISIALRSRISPAST